ncbi:MULTISPECIES: hypothetical protein [unclassified Burkholderia]|uniref:hypothetical protein n=1 Tax=unclassified Burkholderia TaxID=2613784 RepID=UPI001588736F|nr:MULTISPECIES: hypothetical protein [unclassified Burkholderia]
MMENHSSAMQAMLKARNAYEQLTAIPGDEVAPRSFGGKFLNLLGAGALDRKATKRIRRHCLAASTQANEKLSAAKQIAASALTEFEAHKATLFRQKVKNFTGAYSLIDKCERSAYVEPSDCEKVTRDEPQPSFPAMPSGALKIVGGFLLGGAVGGAIGYGLLAAGVLAAHTIPVALVALCMLAGLALAMPIGVKHASRQRDAAREAGKLIARNGLASEIRLRDLEKVGSGVAMMRTEIERLSDVLSTTETATLDPVLEDGSNACTLLLAVLDTPLLDGEGALMAGVIEKLHGQNAEVGELQRRMAA